MIISAILHNNLVDSGICHMCKLAFVHSRDTVVANDLKMMASCDDVSVQLVPLGVATVVIF